MEVQRVPSPSPVTVKGPIRYYDLMQRAMAGDSVNKLYNSNNNNNKGSNRYNCKHIC